MEMAVDPKDVFKTAEVFRASSAILNNHGMPQCMFPMVICSAFSLELYLKALILVESGKPAKGHDLKDLFSKTTPESQKIIRASYETHKTKLDAMFAAVKGVPAPKTDFDFVLHASAKAFEHFRYAFEGLVKDQEGWMAGPICDGVRARIVELQPDWAN
jgi:HEPN domain-containing protein